MKRDIYQEVTNKIIEQLENGTPSWERPWAKLKNVRGQNIPHNAHTGRPYSGVNTLLLWGAEQHHEYSSAGWLTYRQAKELGGHVRKGEKGEPIIFWKFLKKTDTKPNGDEVEKTVPMVRGYTVFNVEQCDGITLPKSKPKTKSPEHELDRNQEIFQFVDRVDPEIIVGGNIACYVPSRDLIRMPEFDQFHTVDGYCQTLMHELTHWTGHESRVDRPIKNRFGDQAYAVEELIAELGSSYLCAAFGIDMDGRQGIAQHASYIESWLTVLKNDKRAIFTAASKAQKAVEWLTNLADERAEELAA